MSAPERIWIDTYPGAGFAFWTAPEESTTEYVRADLGRLPMKSELAALLDDTRRFADVMYFLLVREHERCPSSRCEHLATKARELVGRIEALSTEQEGPS